MMVTFYREPVKGSDTEVWADYQLPQNRAGAIGQYTNYLYNDSGVLKLTKGYIGFYNSSYRGVFLVDAVTTISLASVTAQTWAKVEVTLSGTSAVFTVTDIAGATDPETLPSAFTGAYDQDKQGFYIDANKRVIGVVWTDSGNTLTGIVNVKPFINGYIGTIDDGDDAYFFDVENEIRKDYTGLVPIGSIIAWHKSLTGVPKLPSNFVECDGSVLSDADSPLNGQTIPDLNGDGRFLRGGSTSGTSQGFALQYHGHNGKSYYGSGAVDNKFANIDNALTLNATVTADQIVDPITLSGHDAIALAEETRPVNMSVVWIMRVK